MGECCGKQIAIDVKTICGAGQQLAGGKLHIVSAWVKEDQITRGQVRPSEKCNEITAIPEPLKLLDVQGAVITIDAMGCQFAIADETTKQEADYVLAVKQNQNRLYEAVAEYFEWAVKDPIEQKKLLKWNCEDHEHGRHCHRTTEVTHDVGWYISYKEWIQLSAMIRVTRHGERNGKKSMEQAHDIGSAALDAKRLA